MDLSQIELVLLDRDGVINYDSPDYIKSPEEWAPLPSAINAIVSLQAYVEVAVCTNQSGVGRGYFSEATLGEIHNKLNTCLKEAGGRPLNIFYCPHHPSENCPCRKPKPELLLCAMGAFGVPPNKTLYAGDSEKDLLAARNARCWDVLILTGNGAQTKRSATGQNSSLLCADLGELAEQIAQTHQRHLT